MSDFAISLLVTVSVFVWMYNQFSKRTGGNTQQALIAAGLVALLVFFVSFSLLKMLFSSN